MGSTTETSFTLTVYRGTFIQLPRLPDSGAKPELVRNQGALWVSASDGRIKGWDWQAHDDTGFAELLTRNGWVDIGSDITGQGSKTRVKIITASEEKNEFFFPGFIGIYTPSHPVSKITQLTY
jgi:guanine deaminase